MSVSPEPPQTPASSAIETYCPACGYDLRGRTSARCPECGLVLDFIDAPHSAIPWVRRKEIGRLRAYCATVWLVVSRPRIWTREMYRPVAYPDAQRFRGVTVVLLFLSLAAAGLGIAWSPDPYARFSSLGMPPRGPPPGESWLGAGAVRYGAATLTAMLVATAAAVLAFLIVVTGAPSYLFHPRTLPIEQQNRTLALSYYAAAPWAIAAVVIVVLNVLTLFGSASKESALYRAQMNGMILAFFAFAYWLELVRLARRTLRSPGNVWKVAVLTPVLWLLGGGLALVVPSLILFYLWLILDSLL